MDAKTQRGNMDRLDLAIKKLVTLFFWQGKIDIRHRSTDLTSSDTIFEPLQSLINRGMPIRLGILRILSSHPARLQIDRKSPLVSDIVKPMPKLMRSDP